MTPAIWNRVAAYIEKKEKALVLAGTIALVIFVVILIAVIGNFIESPFLLFPAISIVMFCCGLGLIRYLFKTQIEEKYTGFAEYLETASLFTKLYMWYGAIFMALWLTGVTVIFIASIVISLQNH